MLNGRLPPAELDRAFAALSVNRTHERARLLAGCGWTQRELAERIGKSHVWVHRQMLFGRFLDLLPKGNKVTERVFRTHWERTEKSGDETTRLEAARQLFEEADEVDTKPSRAVADKLMARYADGKWHALDAIAATLETPRATIQATMDTLGRPPYRAKMEVKTVGIRPTYRIFHADKMIRLSELKEKFGPLVEELKQQGKTNAATVSIGAVKHCAHRLQQIIDEWSQ
jgi:hypothetical protein